MKNIVAIPTRDNWEMLLPLVDTLLVDPDVHELFVFDSSDKQEAADRLFPQKSLHILAAKGWPIYEMWNHAITIGKYEDANLALLNDDIEIPNKFIATLAEALEKSAAACAYPDWTLCSADAPTPTTISWQETTGTGKDGGMSGWAFMLRAADAPYVDTQFRWWCGDDDIERTIRSNGGKIVCVKGLGLTHHASSTAQKFPELHDIGWQDVERFKEKWGSW